MTADEAHRQIATRLVNEGEMTSTQASCVADAFDERLDLTRVNESVDPDDRIVAYAAIYECLGPAALPVDGFAECMAAFHADWNSRLTVGELVHEPASLLDASNDGLFRASLQCADPTIPPTVIDCIMDGLEAEFPTVWDHDMTPDEQQHAATLVEPCMTAD